MSAEETVARVYALDAASRCQKSMVIAFGIKFSRRDLDNAWMPDSDHEVFGASSIAGIIEQLTATQQTTTQQAAQQQAAAQQTAAQQQAATEPDMDLDSDDLASDGSDYGDAHDKVDDKVDEGNTVAGVDPLTLATTKKWTPEGRAQTTIETDLSQSHCFDSCSTLILFCSLPSFAP
jgi:hypothetical protein